jgi:thymidylate synthase (FAD)
MNVFLVGMTTPVFMNESNDIEIDKSKNLEDLIGLACDICYNPNNDNTSEVLSSEKKKRVISKTLNEKHMSVYEHVSFTFKITGVTRSLMSQLTRHRIASFSVQSQRYCKLTEPQYLTPESIQKNQLGLEEYTSLMELNWKVYNKLIDKGIPKEDARMVLPNSCLTICIMTMNIRELFHFFKLRMCTHSQWEIQELSVKIFKLVEKTSPLIFKYVNKQCEHEKCFESCGGCVLRHLLNNDNINTKE